MSADRFFRPTTAYTASDADPHALQRAWDAEEAEWLDEAPPVAPRVRFATWSVCAVVGTMFWTAVVMFFIG
ncbi:MAG TPA: hypothetical protein VF638_14225 [Sphingomonas sp.]|jgi:hypothetical protein